MVQDERGWGREERGGPSPPVPTHLTNSIDMVLRSVDSIDRWRESRVQPNLVQLGVSLVRGILRRGLANPFGISTAVEPPPLLTEEGLRDMKRRALSETAAVEATSLSQDRDSTLSSADPRDRRLQHDDAEQHGPPSPARRVLVESADRAPATLYMGMLTAFLGAGIPTFCDGGHYHDHHRQQHSPQALGESVGLVATPHPTLESPLPTGDQRIRLSEETSLALYELHRVATDIIEVLDAGMDELDALTKMILNPVIDGAVEHSREAFREAEEKRHRTHQRLGRTLGNLYSILALLDFFSVDAANAWPSPSKQNSLSPATAAFSSPQSICAATLSNGDSTAALRDGSAADDGQRAGARLPSITADAAAYDDPIGVVFTAHSAEDRPRALAYSTELFAELFRDTAQLPRCAWRVFSRFLHAFAELQKLGPQDLREMHSDVLCPATAIIREVLSYERDPLLQQMTRLCRSFDILRVRVCAQSAATPLHTASMTLLDYGLRAIDKAVETSLEADGWDPCDLHWGTHHNIYPRQRSWVVHKANRKALGAVMEGRYVYRASTSAPQLIREAVSCPSKDGMAHGMHGVGCADRSEKIIASLMEHLAATGTGSRDGDPLKPRALPGTASSDGDSVSRLTVVPGYVGLRNSGNTCFLNSVMQLLSSATLFRNDLVRRAQELLFSLNSAEEANNHLQRDMAGPSVMSTAALETLLARYGCRLAVVLLLGELQWRGVHHHERYPVVPDYLTRSLPPPFNDHRQHDASEFWHALLDQLDGPTQPGGAVVARWFSGRTTTSISCLECGSRRVHANTFWDLSTPLCGHAGTFTATASPGLTASPRSPATDAEHISAVRPAGRLVDHVEIDYFPGATAITTTYACAPESFVESPPPTITTAVADALPEAREGALAGNEEEEADDSEVLPLVEPLANAGRKSSLTDSNDLAVLAARESTATEEQEGGHTLQHLLLRLLHPALNKERLHGSNALECERCGHRTDTELTTRLVAEVGQSGGGADGAAGRPTPADDAEEAERQRRAPSRCSTTAADTVGVTGDGAPFYLVVQLNRFAYQRTTHAYTKVTDGVPLNDVVVVPLYPPSSPAVRSAGDSSATAPPLRDEEEGEEEEEEEAAAAAAHRSAIPHPLPFGPPPHPMRAAERPTWLGYRLRSIIVHSGATPSSGHYFTLTRPSALSSTSTAAAAMSTLNEEAEEESAKDATSDATVKRDSEVDLASACLYVRELGSALTQSLGKDRRRDERLGGTASSAAAVELPEGPSAAPCGYSPACASVKMSLSGDRLYSHWVMLNDSNVQAVEPETMRDILNGCGGGVYSSKETPYMLLYERLPMAFDAMGASEGITSIEAVEEEGEEAGARATLPDAAMSVAAAVADVAFVPEVASLFEARLAEEKLRTEGPSTSSAAPPTAVPETHEGSLLIPDDDPWSSSHAASSTPPSASIAAATVVKPSAAPPTAADTCGSDYRPLFAAASSAPSRPRWSSREPKTLRSTRAKPRSLGSRLLSKKAKQPLDGAAYRPMQSVSEADSDSETEHDGAAT